jgi:putative membrane protein
MAASRRGFPVIGRDIAGQGLIAVRAPENTLANSMPIQRTICSFFILAGNVVAIPLAWGHTGEAHDAATGLAWNADPWLIGCMAAAGFLYARGIQRLWANSRRGAGVSIARAACFVAGMATLVVALLSPVDTLGAELFSMHMVQHELLMLVAAPLLVCGRPLAVAIWAFRLAGRLRIAQLIKFSAVQTPWHLLTRPSVAWLLHAVVLWGWHFPTLFQAGLTSDFLHAVQHFSFLASALLFWSALIGPQWRLRAGAAVIYILTTLIHTGMLGALLTFSTRIWYPIYAHTTQAWGLSVLEDQQLGGLIMWVPAGFILLLTGLLIAAKAILPEMQPDRPPARGADGRAL